MAFILSQEQIILNFSLKNHVMILSFVFKSILKQYMFLAGDFVGILVKGRDYLERLKFRRVKLEKGLFGDRLFSHQNSAPLPFEQMKRKTIAIETYFLFLLKMLSNCLEW